MNKQVFLAPILVAGISLPTAQVLASTDCTVEALNGLGVPNVTVAAAVAVGSPATCQVTGTVRTQGFGAPDGSAGFQVTLPTAWNGKFLFYGVGGFSGSFNNSANGVDRVLAQARGYATAITDTGHQSPLGATDAGWALIAPGVPDEAKITDYYFRATHQVTESSKALVQAFYGQSIGRAYFDGCSNGGRQAFVEATRFPGDFDGIVAGAPFMDIRTILGGVKIQKVQLASADDFVTATKLRVLVDPAVYASCDAADGVPDGLIQNPTACAFDPNTLVTPSCTANDPTCLTQGQANTLKSYFSALRDQHGRLVYTGETVSDLDAFGGMDLWTTSFFSPGQAFVFDPNQPISFTNVPNTQASFDLNAPEPWGNAGFNPAPIGYQFTDHFIKYVVARDPNFNVRDYGVGADGVVDEAALRLFDRRSRAGDGDDPFRLIPFIARGKKMIVYHGLSDPALAATRTIKHYEDLERITPGGFDRLQRSIRLFLVPDMQHCAGGPGPNSFDTLTALENWVEQGQAPDGIVATHFANNNPTQPITRTMPLCKFPEQARYNGTGDVNSAANWTCSPDDRRLLDIGLNGEQAGLGQRRHGPF
jgi:Tannase and feruloyl esterase